MTKEEFTKIMLRNEEFKRNEKRRQRIREIKEEKTIMDKYKYDRRNR